MPIHIVSFVIPVYNSGLFLLEAVQSILDSDFSNWGYEIICVNDCSNDAVTLNCLNSLLSDARIRVIHLDVNSGPAVARNMGVKIAKGDWISFLRKVCKTSDVAVGCETVAA